MLRELELLPVWRQRKDGQTQTPTQAVAPALAPQAQVAAQTIPVYADTEPPLPSPVPEQGRSETIQQMDWQSLQDCVAGCVACVLSKTRTQTVFGVGDPNAEWLFVGEAPGAEEDRKGEPFVGQAGKLLDNMLAAIGLKRGQNVYIANVLKCRPPENRDPQGEEVAQCDPFLKRQVELIKPKLIVALGKFAAQSLLNSDSTIGSMRAKLHDYHGVPVIVTYHPAYLLRTMKDKAKAWEDLCFARSTMQALQSAAKSQSKETSSPE
jgi:DNA polymerase